MSDEKVGHSEESGLDEFLVCGTVSFAVCTELLREQCRKSLVKGDQVLSVCPTLKLVLSSRSQETKRISGCNAQPHRLKKRDIRPTA